MSVNVYNKTEDKLIPVAGGTVYADSPIGSIIPYGGSQVPSGWLLCDGRSLSKNDYFDLWKVIGYNYGGSDSTFNIPDLRNKAVMGAGTTGVLGASQRAQLPNITGKIDNKSGTFGIMGFSSGTSSFSGALIGSEAKGAVYTGQQNTSACKVVTFDASHSGASTDINGNNVYKNNGETRPANVRCNFIIKAKHTPVPTDFIDSVNEAITEELHYNNRVNTNVRTFITSSQVHTFTATKTGLLKAYMHKSGSGYTARLFVNGVSVDQLSCFGEDSSGTVLPWIADGGIDATLSSFVKAGDVVKIDSDESGSASTNSWYLYATVLQYKS